ncbi:MAG TPA: ATP-binding protein [Ktedonobacteraceae bacterium]
MGWGLGLTVSKEIVQRHGGRIRVQSTEKGTTFFVQLLF